MAFPDDRLRHRLQAAFGADADASPTTWTWTDITAALNDQKITITRGQANESAEPAPTSISLVLDNVSGDFTPDNPLGAHYPDIDMGVPLRYAVDGATTHLALDGTGSATTPDTAALDITGDLDVRVEATLDNWYPTGTLTGLAGKYTTTGNQRSWTFYVQDGRLKLSWSVDGTNTNGWTFTSAQFVIPPSGRLAVRATLDVDNGAGSFAVTFYTAPSIAGPWAQLGTVGTATGTTSIYNSTSPLAIGPAVLPVVAGFENAMGQVHAVEVRNGIDGSAVANPVFSAVAEGATVFNDAAGRTWTLAGDAAIAPWQKRFAGNADSWEPLWPWGDLSDEAADYEGESQVTVTASGILRRLGQGQQPLYSAMRRELENPTRTGIVAYWPCEDGQDATQLASAIAGHPALQISGDSETASYTDWAASDALPVMRAGSLTATVPTYTPTDDASLRFFMNVSGVAAETHLFSLHTAGTAEEWRVTVNNTGSLRLRVFDRDGTQLHDTGFITYNVTGRRLSIGFELSRSGSNVNWALYGFDISASTLGAIVSIGSSSGTLNAQTAGRITRIRVGADKGLADTAIGHISLANSLTAYANTGSAMVGWSGETAADRVWRLCREEGVPFILHGTTADTEQVGPQRPGEFVALLTECAAVDGGILGEQRAAFGLAYRTRVSLYNQEPAVVLHARANEITSPFAPVLDDQRLRNAITVSRDGGSSATVADTASITKRRRYTDAPTVNAYSDDRLPQLASWRLHLGTWPGMRYPSVSLDLAEAPHLITTWLGMDYGVRLQVTDLPPQHPTDLVDLLLQGYSETISPTRWSVQANTTPAGPYTVGATATYEDFEDTTLEVTAVNGGNAAWARSTAHFNTGSWSLRSGAIGNNQTSDWVVSIPPGSTEMRVWYWTSSEAAGPGYEGDRLVVLVDGVQVLRAQGTTPWTQVIVDVTGKSQVIFRYAKDNSTAVGEDAVHIDDLSFTGIAPVRVDTDGSELASGVTATATSLSVTVTDGPLWITSAAYPQEFPFDAALGGERIRVTAISGTTSPQTWTVIRSANGIVKPHDANTAVRLADPMITAL